MLILNKMNFMHLENPASLRKSFPTDVLCLCSQCGQIHVWGWDEVRVCSRISAVPWPGVLFLSRKNWKMDNRLRCLVFINLLLQTGIWKREDTGHSGLSHKWQQVCRFFQLQSAGDVKNALPLSELLSFPFLSDLPSVFFMSGHRAVWNYREAASEFRLDTSYAMSAVIWAEKLCCHPSLIHQGSRIDEQRCVFPLPLKVNHTKKYQTPHAA